MQLLLCSYWCCKICNQSWGHFEVYDQSGKCVWTGPTYDLDIGATEEMRADIIKAQKELGCEFDLSSDSIYDWETE